MITLTVCSWWEDEMARERIGQSLLYAKAKKMYLLTFDTHGCLKASLKDATPYRPQG